MADVPSALDGSSALAAAGRVPAPPLAWELDIAFYNVGMTSPMLSPTTKKWRYHMARLRADLLKICEQLPHLSVLNLCELGAHACEAPEEVRLRLQHDFPMWSFAFQTNYVVMYRADLVTFALEPTLGNVPVTVRKQRDPRSPQAYQHYKSLPAHMKVEGLLAPVHVVNMHSRSSDAHPLTNGVRTETIKWLAGTCATPWLVGGDLNTSSWHIQRTCPSAAIIEDAAPNLARRDIAFHHSSIPVQRLLCRVGVHFARSPEERISDAHNVVAGRLRLQLAALPSAPPPPPAVPLVIVPPVPPPEPCCFANDAAEGAHGPSPPAPAEHKGASRTRTDTSEGNLCFPPPVRCSSEAPRPAEHALSPNRGIARGPLQKDTAREEADDVHDAVPWAQLRPGLPVSAAAVGARSPRLPTPSEPSAAADPEATSAQAFPAAVGARSPQNPTPAECSAADPAENSTQACPMPSSPVSAGAQPRAGLALTVRPPPEDLRLDPSDWEAWDPLASELLARDAGDALSPAALLAMAPPAPSYTPAPLAIAYGFDGHSYTEQDFLQYYGAARGREVWELARRVSHDVSNAMIEFGSLDAQLQTVAHLHPAAAAVTEALQRILLDPKHATGIVAHDLQRLLVMPLWVRRKTTCTMSCQNLSGFACGATGKTPGCAPS